MSNYSCQSAVKCEAEVQSDGRVEITVPFAPGSHVVLFVVEERDAEARDLLSATESTLEFWNNPLDDEDWNRA